MSLSVPMNPNGIPGVVSIAASQAQSVGSAAATAASSVAGQAQSAVSSAITTVESAMGSVIPKNCSLGVTYFCLGFTDHIDCKELPLNLSSIIPSSVPIIGQPSTLASLDQALAVVKPGTIEGVLIMGLCFAAFSIGPDVICICCLLLFRLGLIPFWGTSRLAAFPRGICSAVCCMPLIALIIILYGILSKLKSMDLPKEITVEAGPASGQILVALICAIFMCIFTIAGWLLNSADKTLPLPHRRLEWLVQLGGRAYF
jgi:hypothetical protein